MRKQLNDKLIQSVDCENLEEVKRLLANGADVNAVNDKGYTALILAARKGNAEIAEVLLVAEANPNAVNNDGLRALHFTAHFGHAEITKILLAAGSYPNAVTNKSETVLDLANEGWSKSETQEKAKKFKEVVRILKEAGAKE